MKKNKKFKPLRLLLKIVAGLIAIIVIMFVINDFVMPNLNPTIFGSPSDLSSIEIAGTRPFVPVAGFFCVIQGGTFQAKGLGSP